MEPNNQTTIVQTKSNGALTGSIIIIIILILGGIYFWQKNLKEKEATAPDDTVQLEGEVNSIDLDSLDNGI